MSGRLRLARRAARRVLPVRTRRRLRSLARRLRAAPPTGVVETFTRSEVYGWVSAPTGTAALDVVLRVNGTEVARTRAAAAAPGRSDARSELKRFRFVLSHIWRYVGSTDRLTVTVGGARLPIAGHGMRYVPTTRAARSVGELHAALADGQVFSRVGRLQRPRGLDLPWQQDVTRIADQVRRDLAERLGLEVFYTYGSLLGAIREGGYIGHDDDLDLGYLSARSDPVEVGTEFYGVAVALLDAGWIVEPFGPVLHVFTEFEDGRRQRVDLFQHYFDADGLLQVPWGMAGTRHVRRAEWRGVREVPFAGASAPVPAAGEAMLAQLYGADWREPQPGFSWARDRTESVPDAEMPRELCDRAYWLNFYRQVTFDAPSSFQVELARRPDLPARVVDLGCGEGRDARAFAATGRAVLALDRSDAALAALAQAGGTSTTTVDARLCDVRDPDQLRAVTAPFLTAGEPTLFYLRFLLHGLTDDGTEALLASLGRLARPGDVVAAEFRTRADAELPKHHHTLTREFKDGPALAARLQQLGFVLESSDEGRGRSVYGTEDPVLHRLVARRA